MEAGTGTQNHSRISHAALWRDGLSYHLFAEAPTRAPRFPRGTVLVRVGLRRWSLRLCALWGGLLLAGAAPAAPQTSEFRLDNGLKLVVREDHRAPVKPHSTQGKPGTRKTRFGKTQRKFGGRR